MAKHKIIAQHDLAPEGQEPIKRGQIVATIETALPLDKLTNALRNGLAVDEAAFVKDDKPAPAKA